MVIERGEIWWTDLGEPKESAPGYRRPVLIVQSDTFNRSRIATTVVAAITSNVAARLIPGTVRLPKRVSGLARDSVINLSQLATVDRVQLDSRAGAAPAAIMRAVDEALNLVLSL